MGVDGGSQAALISDNVVSIPCGVTGISVNAGSQALIIDNQVTDFRFSGIEVRDVLASAVVSGNVASPGAGAAEFSCE